jgi:hypothetical protein
MKGQDSFHARYRGICKGCGKWYRRGDNVWSPKLKGGLRTQSAGLLHISCQPHVSVKVATPEQIADVKRRAKLRRDGQYSEGR